MVAVIVAAATVAAACSGGGGEEPVTTVSTAPTPTTTTMDERACALVARDAVGLVEDLVRALDGVPYEALVDRERWPDDLLRVESRGEDLQRASDEAGCDEALIRGAVVAAVERMDAGSRAGQLLLELLAPGG
jgi:hypothetical protein